MLRLRTDNTGRESLVRPFVNFCIDLKSPYFVHVVCWSVLKKVAQPNDTDPQWLRRLTLVQHNLRPFLKVIPFRNSSPEFLDSGLEEELERCTERIQAWKNDRNIDVFARLPNEIIQVIHDFLDSHHDMLNLWQVTSVEPSPKKWLPPGRKYLAYGSPFMENNTFDKAARMIQRLLWNLHVEPSRFPHCANYSVVWDNAELVIEKAGNPFLGLDTDMDIPEQHCTHITATLLPKQLFGFSTHASELLGSKIMHLDCSSISFHFSHLPDRQYLCGFQLDDHITGYSGHSSNTVPRTELCGLRLVSDGHGYIAVQVKKNTAWDACWYGSSPEAYSSNENQMTFSQLEWPAGCEGDLIISLDVRPSRNPQPVSFFIIP